MYLECRDHCVRDKLWPNVEFREEFVGAVILHEAGETLVQPQVRPPLHGDQVA